MDNGSLVLLAVSCIYAFLMLKTIVWQFQNGGYKPVALFKNNREFRLRFLPLMALSIAFACVLPSGVYLSNPKAFIIVLAVVYYTAIICFLYYCFNKPLKKPLAVTARATRLYVISFLATVLLGAHYFNQFLQFGALFGRVSIFVMPLVLPIVALIISSVLYPFEQLNNLRYVRRAKKKLSSFPMLIKIGITGSFGKTSVKNILAHLLQPMFTVVATEGNYNTPLGIAKSVRNIDCYTDVFIAEMGARHVGDITELTDIVKPRYGIVTGVTGQHLETFKTLENIYYEKLSLIKVLPRDGYGVINRQGFIGEVCAIADATVEYVGNNTDNCYISNVLLSPNGADFTLHLGEKSYTANTKLLGAHNLQNIVSAVAMAVKLNIPHEIILSQISTLPQIPHRLQLIKNGGLTIIDDTYNSNPVGAQEAIATLRQFHGRKVVITPGMVELGEAEQRENKTLGAHIASVADLVILIGVKRAQAVREGMLGVGYDDEKIFNYKSLAEAEREFGRLLLSGDTVLFLNDLPDGYNE